MRNVLIIYHQARPGTLCPDGAMAAAIAHLYYVSQGIPHHFMGDCYRNAADYPRLPDFEVPGDVGELMIVDFSYPRSWLDYWESNGLSVKVLDHHEPKFKLIGDFSGAILDADECGATIAWKYFFPYKPQPELLLHVKRRDIGADGYYEGLCPESEAINEGLGKMRHDAWTALGDRVFSEMARILLEPDLIPIMQEAGELLIEERDRIIAEACDRSVLRTLGSHEVPFLEVLEPEARYHSLIGNALCKVFPTHPFSWVITPDGGNHLRSARNLSNFDVSAVAREFGGDGHRNAAGFQPPKLDCTPKLKTAVGRTMPRHIEDSGIKGFRSIGVAPFVEVETITGEPSTLEQCLLCYEWMVAQDEIDRRMASSIKS